jgi:flavin reductase (DIM6/NTAB) family NADH-FMN oxidoreductase RutF
MSLAATPDPRALRAALGRFATGVVVVTTRAANGRPVGLTVNSFVPLSLEPPLLAWSLATRSGSLPTFLEAPCFAINVLAEDQEAVSRGFADSAADRFAAVAWAPGLHGVPLLDGCLARFECRTVRRIETGDHWLLLGTPKRFTHGPGAPLVFFAGRYGLPARQPGDVVAAAA